MTTKRITATHSIAVRDALSSEYKSSFSTTSTTARLC